MNNTVVPTKELTPLPLGPPGNDLIKSKLNELSYKMQIMETQAVENSKFDPLPPKPMTTPMIIEKFTTTSLSSTLAVIGVLFVVYGLLRK
jgi:hypothetical protein